jgi:uncharacterized Zn-finger protein
LAQGTGTNFLRRAAAYLNLAKDGQIDCPYCGKRFVLKAGAPAAAH